MKNKSAAMLATAMAVAMMAGLSSLVSAQTMKAPASAIQWEGTWEGKRDGVPSVILKVTQDGSAIQGQAEFNLLKAARGGTPTIAGTMIVPMVNPHLQGNTLAFQIIREDRSGDAAKRAVLNFTLEQAGDRAAKLNRTGGEPDLEVDMSARP